MSRNILVLQLGSACSHYSLHQAIHHSLYLVLTVCALPLPLPPTHSLSLSVCSEWGYSNRLVDLAIHMHRVDNA